MKTATVFPAKYSVFTAAFVALTACLLLLTAFPKFSKAGVSGYKMTVGTGSAISMGGANVIWQGFGGSRWYYGDYVWSGGIGMPFNFKFDGTNYNVMQVYSSGMITLGPNTNTSPPTNNLSNTPAPTIASWWDDLFISGCQYCQTASISYQFFGSSPNRYAVIQWSHIDGGYQSGYNELWINTQIRIYENGTIEFYYGTMGEGCGYTYNPPTSASIGLANGKNNFVSVSPGSKGSFTISSSSANNSVNLNSTPINSGTLLTFKSVPNVQLGITPQPKNYNFGSLGTGESATTNVTLSHVGTEGRLSINSVSLTGNPDFTIVSSPASSDSIDVGGSRTVTVKFAPIIDGVRTAVLTVISTGLDSGTQTFSLTGIGLAPLISVDTNVLFKNKFVKLGDSLVSRIKIFSTSNPTLIINALQIVGADASEFYISRGLTNPAGIPGGSLDSIFVGYRATKEGRHIATLNIINNSINNPVLPITLWGTGVLPHIVLTPNPLLFDSTSIGIDTCKKIRIYNPGTDTLLIKSNLLVSNDGDFTYSGLVGADSIIAPDKFKEVTVCFKPKAKGSRIARLRITTNIPKTFEQPSRDTASQFLIDIRGTGVPTGVLSQAIGGAEGGGWIDSTLIGTEICINDSLTNNGDADVLINKLTVAGAGASTYTISGVTVPFILKANSTVVVRICATPKSRGFQTATLTIDGSASEKAIQNIATLNVKGLLACANALPTALFEQTLTVKGNDSTLCTTVTNCGDIAATYTATITGDTANVYSVTPGSSATVNPGQTATFCVKYSPSAAGKSPATLTIS
ncbi:MAG TPA: choice-of-anchor D domain-containing protein, partial [Candidatus Kapabacteria bacterium]|nr:choice-of-anchor D domain-containing protein [Candidatus Kapabacteria bacterium]